MSSPSAQHNDRTARTHRRVRVLTLERSHFCPCGHAMAVAEWLARRRGRSVPRRRPGMVAKVRTQGRARPPARSQHICPPESFAPACARAQAALCAPSLAALAARAKLQHSVQVGGRGGVQSHRDPAVSALVAGTWRRAVLGLCRTGRALRSPPCTLWGSSSSASLR